MRIMYDSVAPSAIPTTAQLVAGYVDGAWAWPAAAWARFPNSIHVPIAVFTSTDAGIVGDCEQGDMTPQTAVQWVQMRRRAGVDPTIYCSEGNWASVIAAFDTAGVTRPHWWVAAYPGGGAVIPAGAVAHQYADPNSGSGGNYDISAVADYWPGVDTGVDMPLTQADANLVAATLLDWYITTPSKPKGTAGRQVYDVLGDGERIQAAVAALSGALSTDEAAILAAVSGVGSDVKAGVAQLATSIASVSSPQVQLTDAQLSAVVGGLATQLEAALPPAVWALLKAAIAKS